MIRHQKIELPSRPSRIKTPEITHPLFQKQLCKKDCLYLLVLLILPFLIIILGLFLNDITPTLLPIPTIYLLFVASISDLIFIVFLIFYSRSKRDSSLLFILVAILGIVAIISSILLIADLTQIWLDLWVWLTVIILLSFFVAILALPLAFYLVMYCGKTPLPKYFPSIRQKSYLIKGKAPIQPLPYDPAQYFTIQAHLKSSGPAGLKKPKNWPKDRVFSPLKFTGPYNRPQFSEIQVLLEQEHATTYFNDYFDAISIDMPNHEKTIYQLYFRNLPTSKTPDPPPGTNIVGTNLSNAEKKILTLGILLQLRQLNPSSRYGGSIRLDFELLEDYFYEFYSGVNEAEAGLDSFFYDLSRLQMSVFIKPIRFRSTTSPPVLQKVSTVIEFHPVVDVAYTAQILGAHKAPGRALTGEEFIKAESFLNKQLISYSETIAKKFEDTLGPFTLGFEHNELRDTVLVGDFVVDRVAITDGDIKLWTHKAQYYLTIDYCVKKIKADTEWGKEEFRIRMKGSHSFYSDFNREDEYIETQMRKYNRKSSPFYNIITIPINEIIELDINGDPVQAADEFENPITHDDGTPCYKLRQGLPRFEEFDREDYKKGFYFWTSVRISEEDPFENDIFYDYRKISHYNEDPQDFIIEGARWIDDQWKVEIADGVPCGAETEFMENYRESRAQSMSNRYHVQDFTISLGGPNYDNWVAGSVTITLRRTISRR